jgi:hypothetical protein
MSVLIYTDADTNPYLSNSFEDPKNYVEWNGTSTTPASAAPTAADTVLYGAGNYVVTDGGGPDTMGAAVFVPGANVMFGEGEPANYTIGTMWELPNSHVSFGGASVTAGNVVLTQGSTLTLNSVSQSGFDTISNIWNEGGALTLINQANLHLGGPGFVQTGGFTSSETDVHDGTNQWINLGNVAQGSHPAALDFDLQNGTNHAESGFLFAQGDGGFTPTLPGPVNLGPNGLYNYTTDEHPAGSLAVNTSQLGGHWEQLSYVGAGGVMATTGIWDNVVKA